MGLTASLFWISIPFAFWLFLVGGFLWDIYDFGRTKKVSLFLMSIGRPKKKKNSVRWPTPST